jgi:subtilisin family serine protease
VKYEPSDAYTELDPRLQRLCDRRDRGLESPVTSSTEEGEVAVIARVTSVPDWEAISEVKVGANLGASEDGTCIVTGRIPASRIEAVRQKDAVLSLKAAQRLRPVLGAGTKETHATPELLPDEAEGDQGAGVIVGLVDFGCDFAHENFLNDDGTTRVLAIWDQNAEGATSGPFGFGRLHRRDEINQALQAADPYQTLGYGPDPADDDGTHGTHVMDIATGNGRGTATPGFAPHADILFVEPATTDIAWSGPQAVGSEFGDSAQLLEAIRFIFDEAGTTPCAINVSLGTNGGPHDGSSLVEQGIDAILRQADNRAVVIAASNSFSDGIHAAGTVAQGGTVDLQWVIPTNDVTGNEIEIWYEGGDEFEFELITPDGTSLGTIPIGQSGRVTGDNGEVLLFVSHRGDDPNNHDNVIGVFLERDLPSGTWILRLHGKTVTDGSFHAWIERDDRRQSSFAEPNDNSHTLGSISCGHDSIVVGSYDAHKPTQPISFFSSAGPTRDGREKPEISAPGHDVIAAKSRSKTGVTEKSGTSMAAPAVTGITALVLAEAKARGTSMPIDRIRSAIGESGRHDPPPGTGWEAQYGEGRIDAAAAILAVVNAVPVGQR